MNRIDDQAIAWVAREDRGPLDAQDQDKRDAWLQQDPRHLGAYARARAAFAGMDRASALGSGVDLRLFTARPAGWLRWRRLLPAVGAVAAACLVIVASTWTFGPDHYSTRLGEVLRVPLPDGSVVTLNSQSAVDVDFGKGVRRLTLRKGEALFDVAKDHQRPFVVTAGDARVTAVGTSFSVLREKDHGVQVVVREGVVKVDEAQAPSRLVAANSTLHTDAKRAPRIDALRPDQIGRRLAWREGMLAFDGDTLQQAADKFARYSDLRILIDPAVANRRVVGLYSATDPAGFARAVATSMSLQVDTTADGIYLYGKQQSDARDGGTAPPAHQLF